MAEKTKVTEHLLDKQNITIVAVVGAVVAMFVLMDRSRAEMCDYEKQCKLYDTELSAERDEWRDKFTEADKKLAVCEAEAPQ